MILDRKQSERDYFYTIDRNRQNSDTDRKQTKVRRRLYNRQKEYQIVESRLDRKQPESGLDRKTAESNEQKVDRKQI